MNLEIINKLELLINYYYESGVEDLFDSLGIDYSDIDYIEHHRFHTYDDNKKLIEVTEDKKIEYKLTKLTLKKLNKNNEVAMLLKLISTILNNTGLRKNYNDNWGLTGLYIKCNDVVDPMINLMKLDGYGVDENWIAKKQGVEITDKLFDDNLFRSKPNYHKLITEINNSYVNCNFTACYILIRKMMESLIIDIFKSKNYNAGLYYNQNNNMCFGITKLIDNFKDEVRNSPGSFQIANDTIKRMKKLKNLANIGAHNIRIIFNSKDIDENRQDINIVFQDLFNSLT